MGSQNKALIAVKKYFYQAVTKSSQVKKMLFNSLDFAVFLPVVFLIYWLIDGRSLKLQNSLIVVSSYIFYGWWDWRFLSLIFLSTLVDFFIGLKLESEANENKRKLLLFFSLLFNLGFLGFFKYFNFFLDNVSYAFSFMGMPLNCSAMNIVLPVGISFYTFQTLSYSIDVFRRKLKPTTDFVAFAAFVSFFPQLVAGPIERATHLLPQFLAKREFDYPKAVDGMRQMLWGLFKKIVVADNCAEFANLIFNNHLNHHGSTLLLGAVFFSIQIYCDFSGYSDIAIGTARLFGFSLMRNFAYPYFSRDIAEFWRRWHISLSTWFRDYVYIPLGGSQGGLSQKIFNTMVIFLISGFWHGANWTFVLWGFINALYFIPLLLKNKNRQNIDTIAAESCLPNIREFSAMFFTFTLTVFAWVVFRAESVSQATEIFARIFSVSLFSIPVVEGMKRAILTLVFAAFLFLMEWQGRRDSHALEKTGLSWNRPFRHAFYYLIILIMLFFGGNEQQFIYFQF